MIATVVFWACLILVAYTYALYPCILFAAYAMAQARTDLRYLTGQRNRRRQRLEADELPRVTVIIPAHNEEEHIVHIVLCLLNVTERNQPAIQKISIIVKQVLKINADAWHIEGIRKGNTFS